MRWEIFAIGKPKLSFAAAGIEEYATRLKPLTRVGFQWIKQGPTENNALLDRSDGMFRIVLDERGESVRSSELANKIAQWEQRSIKSVALLIGGADGHTDAIRTSADWVWSLSSLTLQHELALLLAMEQIYRAYTIKAGLPYHRE